ncbi:SURF1 family protein [Bordetella sp. BOR01]|uniref:SURF1 family protein n=1 Tax=Bordetella sp. BOR01 TaxID=2854779 RepID=UPI001C4643B4|nr:SURF1 family protein [Bordetella sp. BOR01]MBV7486634.1 SURF1 family protein [Bordetella sp. BOR01]
MTPPPPAQPLPPPRRTARIVFLSVLALVLFAVFCSLGVWQVQRRAWKLELISQVDQRVHLPAAQAPGPAQWPSLSRGDDEYRHVQATGTPRYDQETLVQATTDYGSGYWVMTPLQLRDGGTVLINRGFVLPAWRKRPNPDHPAGEISVAGLLRMSEPDLRFLRTNDPARNIWYSRDTGAIAAAHGLGQIAPYFIDVEKGPGQAHAPAVAPVPGLTVTDFPNNHLSYAITWFALAAMVIVGAVIAVRVERREREDAQG